jgi:hypothetical protein
MRCSSSRYCSYSSLRGSESRTLTPSWVGVSPFSSREDWLLVMTDGGDRVTECLLDQYNCSVSGIALVFVLEVSTIRWFWGNMCSAHVRA